MITKKSTLTTFLVMISMGLFMTSCDDSTTGADEGSSLESHKAKNIEANADAGRGAPPDFIFYSLEDSTVVPDEDSASTKWDIAFSGANIIVNNSVSGPGDGGAVMLDQSFSAVQEAPQSGYKTDTDTTLALGDWYNYTGNNEPQHAVLPKDVTIVVRTADGDHYAKIDILSYYEGNPDTSTEEFADMESRPPSRHYTFKYVLQADGSRSLK